jgi:4-carboxymuconolactone decarboxylase
MTDRKETGRAILRQTVGEEYFQRRVASTNDFNRKLRDLTDEYCFGEVWSGEALSAKFRSLLVISLLAGMGRVTELRTHVNGALNNGASVAEIHDALLHVAIYCGIPAGVEAFRTAEQVLKERGLLD